MRDGGRGRAVGKGGGRVQGREIGRGQLGSRTGGCAGRAAAGPVGAGGPRIASTFLFSRASARVRMGQCGNSTVPYVLPM